MKLFPQSRLDELLSAYLGNSSSLPPPDPEGQAAFMEEYFRAGAPELPYLYRYCLYSLHLLCPFMTGKPFSRLNPQAREDFLNRLLASRNPLLRGVALLAGMPLYMSYYRRPEVSVPLGFDPQALREEADLRVVTRDGTLPPRKEGEP
ncbi:hypothetical protein [Candidatus Solincola sp.]|nr:hypothetical protein [Actinomycetota bacterium]MDI7252021.1 hypothetical protein [Actinomycetota bacterium]